MRISIAYAKIFGILLETDSKTIPLYAELFDKYNYKAYNNSVKAKASWSTKAVLSFFVKECDLIYVSSEGI